MSTSVPVLQGSPDQTVKLVSLTDLDIAVHLTALFCTHPATSFQETFGLLHPHAIPVVREMAEARVFRSHIHTDR